MLVRRRQVLAIAAAWILAVPTPAFAQDGLVIQQKSSYNIARIGGGELTQTTMIHGTDRQKTVTEGRTRVLVMSRDAASTEIVRLDEGRIHRVDDRRRQVQSLEIAALRAEMEQAQRQMEAAAAQPADPGAREDVRVWVEREPVRRSGERRTINGFNTEHALVKMTVMAEDTRTGEKAPMFHLTADLWLDPSQKEATRVSHGFARAYTAQLGLDPRTATNPYGRWVRELFEEMGALEGYPIVTHVALEGPEGGAGGGAQSGESDQSSAADAAANPVGAALGAAFRRANRARQSEPAAANPAATPGRPLLFSMSTEVLSISTAAPDPAEFEIPPGYRAR